MKYKNILTKKFLIQKYWTKKLSIYKIAKLVGCNVATVFYTLKKYNIPRRSHSEALKGKKISEETKKKMSETRKRLGLSKGKKGKNHPNWKGGRCKQNGYIFIYSPNHPHKNNRGYVREHKLVVEKYLGRYLLPTEVVHHINGIRDDNRPKNLIAFINQSSHLRFHKDPNNVKPKEIVFNGREILKRRKK